ncbi:putative PEP-CTERM system TPR-repeat lipoprotein [Duganella sp. CF458]|uniref:XrtA/PEP-CTERM system TPR-repeat protein PrsT n=1 Tax=Duganella sp. CF458 TaxID=1884368 RepID=UPI0008F20348|nr:XrtA/PEP-CTERM system TPR-repeat protein PrsT [Duganella sp. CF458]SFG70185.1 putative PEP-CTERM system TPR-repeat lipoprotein [Duganella sp. CF458]
MSRPITIAAGMALAALLACQRIKPVADVLADARTAHGKGEDRAAVIHLKNLLQQEPGHAAARRMLGELHLALGDAMSAEKELRRALALGQPRHELLPLLVRAMLFQGSYQGLLDELQAEPLSPIVLAWRAHALLGLGKAEDAGQLYTQALRQDGQLVEGHLGQARLALLRNEAGAAADSVGRALAADPHNSDTLRFKGDLLRARHDLDGALATYRSILERDKGNVQAFADIAAVHLMQGKPALARQQLEAARKIQPASLVILYAQGLLDLAEGKHKAALERAQMVLRAAPDHLPSMLLAASVELESGATAQARAHIMRYRQSQPKEVFALRLQAQCDMREGKPQDALALLEPAIADNPQQVDLLALAGEAAMRAGQHELAARWFGRASSLAPESSNLLAANGLSLLSQGQNARALEALEQATQKEGGAASRAGSLLVMTYLRERNFTKARAQVRQMEALGDNPAVQNLKGGVMLASGDLPGARQAFMRSLELDPAHMPALDNLAELDLLEKKAPIARQRYEAALERNRGSWPLLMALAKLEARLGNLKAGINWLERAVAAAPDALAPAQMLAALYLRSGQAGKALQLAQRLHSLRPNEAASLDLLAQAASAAGQHRLALDTLDKLALLHPADADVQLRLARSALAVKRTAAALQAVRKAIAIDPVREDALLLASALMLDGRAFDDARKLARSVQQRQPGAGIGFKLEGDAWLEEGKAADALAPYERAYGIQRSGPVLIALHRALHAAGKAQAADQRMRDWLGQQPSDQPTRLYYASHLLQQSQFGAARREYEIILQRDPDNVLVLNDLAWALLQAKDADALRPAERAYRLAPGNPAVADTLAWILAENGKPARALPLLKKALETAPAATDIRLHYAHALFRSGDKRGARSQCEQLLAVQGFAHRAEVEGLLAKL